MFGSFFADTTASQHSIELAQASHHSGLVLLSLLVVFVSSSAAFYMALTNRQAAAISHRRVSLLCASMVLGLGIWAMHFIGMLAMHLPIPLSYNTLGTALSILPGMVAAWLALWTVQAVHPSNVRLAVSGAMVGIGIGAMHYSGIAAMQLDGRVLFDLPLFALSLLSGLALSVAAFAAHRWIYCNAINHRYWTWRFLPPLLMTAAIASMHYLSMLGLRVQMHASGAQTTADTTNLSLPLLIAGFSDSGAGQCLAALPGSLAGRGRA